MANNTTVGKAVKATRKSLDQVDASRPQEALPHLRDAMDHLTEAIDEAMAEVVLEEGGTLRQAAQLAGLSENAVGPRLARTTRLSGYASPDSGRVTAKGVERAVYDREAGRPAPAPAADTPQKLRFKPRRPTKY
jgi:acyl-CoA reductase-like NAD-dependent aldehyde dehydrogenase